MKYRGKRRNQPSQADMLRQVDRERLKATLIQSSSLSDCIRRLGIKNSSNVRDILSHRMREESLPAPSGKVVRASKLKDLTDQVFGHLRVIERAPTTKSGHTMWLCEEIPTGIRKPVASTHLQRGNTRSFTLKPKGRSHVQWKGFGQISGNLWDGIRRKAIARKLPFEISIQEAWEMYLEQGHKCALSGADIYFPETGKCPYTASLDRIDSTKGYVKGNVQWVHAKVNIMKNRFSQDEFIQFCRDISSKHPAS